MHECERLVGACGVIVQECLSDNGSSFRNQHFKAHLEQFRQEMRHSAVGAHHSNGIAERQIGVVMSIARAMMHHMAIHWPDVADVELWPLAVLYAVHIVNRIPREDSGQSPLEMFSRKIWPRSKFQDFHVFGCPCCVLDSTLADGKKLPRWKPRSDRCVCLGISPSDFSHSVPLVMSLDTGKITSQCHVTLDDWFQTVQADDGNQINFNHDEWHKMFGLTEWQCIPDDTIGEEPTFEEHPQEREMLDRQHQLAEARDVATPREPIHHDEAPRDASTLGFDDLDPSQSAPIPYDPELQAPVAPPPVVPEEPSTPVVSPAQREKDAQQPVVEPPVATQAPQPDAPDPKPVDESPPEREQPTRPRFEPIIRTRSQVAPRRSARLQAHMTRLEPIRDEATQLEHDQNVRCFHDPTIRDPLLAFWASFLVQTANVQHLLPSKPRPMPIRINAPGTKPWPLHCVKDF